MATRQRDFKLTCGQAPEIKQEAGELRVNAITRRHFVQNVLNNRPPERALLFGKSCDIPVSPQWNAGNSPRILSSRVLLI